MIMPRLSPQTELENLTKLKSRKLLKPFPRICTSQSTQIERKFMPWEFPGSKTISSETFCCWEAWERPRNECSSHWRGRASLAAHQSPVENSSHTQFAVRNAHCSPTNVSHATSLSPASKHHSAFRVECERVQVQNLGAEGLGKTPSQRTADIVVQLTIVQKALSIRLVW